MASIRAKHLLVLLLAALYGVDGSYFTLSNSVMFKELKDVSNQTQADSLNLPANASSIRENITDTFSCENRTYGYYADVDNDCQIFHVCLPSQTPSGRNVTYRWSFICPNETIFNQEVLTCTRVKDSIDCADSPSFYHLNMEIGKVSNKTEEGKDKQDSRNKQKRHHEKRQNLVMENFIQEVGQEDNIDNLKQATDFVTKTGAESPMLLEAVIESIEEDEELEQKKAEELDRLIMERHKRNERQMRRGALRFKSDV